MIRFLRRRKGLSCQAVMEVLQSYLDGETDTETAREVASHLNECIDCDLESTVYKNIKLSLSLNKVDLDPVVLGSLQQFGEQVARGTLD